MATASAAGTSRNRAPGFFADFGNLIHDLLRSLSDPYRPELHYMRGPGPKWHAKHNGLQPELVRVRATR